MEEEEVKLVKIDDCLFLKFDDGSLGTLKVDPMTGCIYVDVHHK